MNSNRKKELQEMYKHMKTDMGIVYFECIPNENKYIGYLKDTDRGLNSLKARLNANIFRGRRNLNLQNDWNKYGESNFIIKIIDKLDYDEDSDKTDYTEELKMLLEDSLKKYEGAEVIE